VRRSGRELGSADSNHKSDRNNEGHNIQLGHPVERRHNYVCTRGVSGKAAQDAGNHCPRRISHDPLAIRRVVAPMAMRIPISPSDDSPMKRRTTGLLSPDLAE
jgi:hypothetical protein